MKDFDFRKHGDKLLFALALAVLVLVVFRSFDRRITQVAAPRIVFTQWWQNELRLDVLRELIEEFESLHGGIKIVLKEKSYEELRFELFNPAGFDKTNAPPGDVFALENLWVPELLKREVIESASLPLLSFINVLYYNVNILKETGFSRPPKTRAEFLACARAVAGKEENHGDLVSGSSPSAPGLFPVSALSIALGGNSFRGIYDDVYPWIWAAGAQLIKDGKPNVNSRPVVESFSFLAALNSEDLIAADAFFTDSQKKLDDFISGRTAFMIAGTKDIRLVRERMGDEAFGITTVPSPDNFAGDSFFASAGWAAGIYSGSSHKEEARLFVAFLSGKASLLSDKAGATPAVPPPVSDPFNSKVWDIAINGEEAQDFSGLAGEHELEEIFREELIALFAGKNSAADAAAAIQEKWQAVLGE